MKIIPAFLLIVFALISKAQNKPSDSQAIEMLKRFYFAYNAAWSNSHTGVPFKKLELLQRRYCTKKMRKEVKEEGVDQDPLLGADNTYAEHLKTIKVTKDPVKSNVYTVSYINHTMGGDYKPADIGVVLHVTVVKEGKSFKIDAVDEQL